MSDLLERISLRMSRQDFVLHDAYIFLRTLKVCDSLELALVCSLYFYRLIQYTVRALPASWVWRLARHTHRF